MPDPLIASAFVKIKPEPKSVSSFSKEVRSTIEKSLTARPIKVPVKVQLLPFKAKIQKELSTATFTIKVTPVLAPGFRSQVQKLVTAATADIRVPSIRAITPAGRLPGAAANVISKAKPAATTGPVKSSAAAREEAFQKRLKALTDQRTLATRKLTAAEQAEGTVKQRLKAFTAAEAQARVALNSAMAAQVKLEGTLTQKQAGRLATAVKRAEADLASATAAKAGIQATIDKGVSDRKAEKVAAARTTLEERLAAALKARSSVEQAGAISTTKVAAARAKLAAATSVHAKFEALSTDVAAFHNKVLTQESLALNNLVAELTRKAAAEKVAQRTAVETAIADERAAAATMQRVAAQKLLERGFLATSLAALGARGATLAASFEFLAGAAIATGLFKSVQLAARLEEELNVFRVTAAASAAEMERVSAAALKLGADITLPAVSANEAAEAMTELAKAGLSVEDSISAARGVLQLGTAAQLDNAEAVNITASALNAFGLTGNRAVHVADLLAGAANEAQGGIAEMGGALSSVASVARQAGLSVEDTVAMLTLLAKNGIQGAESGTALRVALLRLIAPTEKAKEELRDLGVQVLDSFGNVRPEVFADIATATNELGASQRNAALQTIFGTRAIRAQAVLGREGAAGLNAMREATNQSGLAAELAGARTQGFGGKVEALKNTAATTGLNLGQVLIPALDLLLQGINKDIQAVNEFITVIRRLAAIKFSDFGLGDLPGDNLVRRIFGKPGDVGRELDKLTAGIPGLKGFFDPVTGTSEEAKRALLSLDEAIQGVEGNLVPLASDLQRIFREKGESKAVEFVRSLRDNITDTTPHAEELRALLDGIERSLIALHRAPTDIELKALFDKGFIPDELIKIQGLIAKTPPLEFDLTLKERAAEESARKAAQNARDKFAISFGTEMAASPLGRSAWDPFFFLAPEAAADAAKKSAAAFSLTFDTEMAALEAGGASDAVILRRLRERREVAQRIFTQAQAKFKESRTKENEDFLRRAAERVNEIDSQIASILQDRVSKRKSAADKIADARNKADQAFLDALGLKRGGIENAILRAEGRAGLADDIKTHTQLRDFLRKKIEEASKTIRDAQTKAEVVQSLTTDLIQENQKLRELNRELIASIQEKFQVRIDIAQIVGSVGSIRKLYAALIDELQKALAEATKGSKLAKELKLQILQTQQAAFDAINEGFELDIQIAQAQERPAAEIRARQRFIEQLKREQDQFKRGTLEWKRLQLEIIEQQKAIEEAQGALEDRNNAFAQMSFEFLTTQQGFAANLLSNLLPSGAIGGTVAAKLAGGASPKAGGAAAVLGVDPMTGRPVRESGGAAGPAAFDADKAAGAAGAPPGPTRGQQSVEIDLLRQILQVLRHMNQGTKHPEAKTAHRRAVHQDDGMGGV